MSNISSVRQHFIPQEVYTMSNAKPIMGGPIDRFNLFFNGIFFHGKYEWIDREVAEISCLFREAAVAFEQGDIDKRNAALRKFGRQNRFYRWWMIEVCHWEPPKTRTRGKIVLEMAGNCIELVNQLRLLSCKRRHHPLIDCGMEPLIEKLLAVAEDLLNTSEAKCAAIS